MVRLDQPLRLGGDDRHHVGFGAVGWVDDWRKVVDKNPRGHEEPREVLLAILIGLLAAFYLAFSVSENNILGVVIPSFRALGQQRLLDRPAPRRPT